MGRLGEIIRHRPDTQPSNNIKLTMPGVETRGSENEEES